MFERNACLQKKRGHSSHPKRPQSARAAESFWDTNANSARVSTKQRHYSKARMISKLDCFGLGRWQGLQERFMTESFRWLNSDAQRNPDGSWLLAWYSEDKLMSVLDCWSLVNVFKWSPAVVSRLKAYGHETFFGSLVSRRGTQLVGSK